MPPSDKSGPPHGSGSSPGSGSFRRGSDSLKAVSPQAARVMVSIFDAKAPRCRCLVRVLCSPGSDSLQATHTFFGAYTLGRFRQQVSERLGLAVYELLSNALKYSSMADEVVLELFETPESVAVRVTNRTINARVSMLTEHMGKIRQGAEALLVEEIRRSVSGGPVKPMLGLARVVHEGSMHLDFISGQAGQADDEVVMTASCRK